MKENLGLFRSILVLHHDNAGILPEEYNKCMNRMMYDAFGYGGYGIVHGIAEFVIFICVVTIIALVVRYAIGVSWPHCKGGACGPHHGHGAGSTTIALDLLRDMFAKCEIDTNVFQERRKALLE